MSQHNIKRRVRALERIYKELVRQQGAFLGIVKFIVTDSKLNALIDEIAIWSLTDATGVELIPPDDRKQLINGLTTGQYLLLGGIARVQLTTEIEKEKQNGIWH